MNMSAVDEAPLSASRAKEKSLYDSSVMMMIQHCHQRTVEMGRLTSGYDP